MQLPPAPARSFASDNAAGVHPVVLEALERCNVGHALAYGADEHTAKCSARFRDLFGADVRVELTFNGTGANIVALATMLGSLPGPNHAVVCTDWAHIAVDETGSSRADPGDEAARPALPGRQTRPRTARRTRHLQGVQHHVQPGVVSITQATELGTLYSAAEIAALCDQAHRMGMLVHLDGARLANATAALGGTAGALRSFTIDAGVDAISFGGTKNGLMGAEAVIFCNPAAAIGAEFVRKQSTQLPSKMRFLAAQFNALLHDDLWIELAAHSNAMASLLHVRAARHSRGRARRPAGGQQSLSLPPPGGHRGTPHLVLLLGLGRRTAPGPLDDRMGHHRGRCGHLRRGGAGSTWIIVASCN